MTRHEELPLFTPEEATRTLPLVGRIAADIARENERLEELLPALRRARIRARSAGADDELEPLRIQVARSTSRLESYLDELRQVGCVLHEPTGVIDFRSILDGRPVALCWRLGESHVRHWHAPGRSHADRCPLPASLAAVSGTACDPGR